MSQSIVSSGSNGSAKPELAAQPGSRIEAIIATEAIASWAQLLQIDDFIIIAYPLREMAGRLPGLVKMDDTRASELQHHASLIDGLEPGYRITMLDAKVNEYCNLFESNMRGLRKALARSAAEAEKLPRLSLSVAAESPTNQQERQSRMEAMLLKINDDVHRRQKDQGAVKAMSFLIQFFEHEDFVLLAYSQASSNAKTPLTEEQMTQLQIHAAAAMRAGTGFEIAVQNGSAVGSREIGETELKRIIKSGQFRRRIRRRPPKKSTLSLPSLADAFRKLPLKRKAEMAAEGNLGVERTIRELVPEAFANESSSKVKQWYFDNRGGEGPCEADGFRFRRVPRREPDWPEHGASSGHFVVERVDVIEQTVA